ncbi:MAG: hypothetical protein OWS74_01680, partial [Firmicutes bacterium]|nr:hypothetical protein [Bacillota bacterium]
MKSAQLQDYLDRSTRLIINKYRKRHVQAALRSEVMRRYRQIIAQGEQENDALRRAMMEVGTADRLARRVAAPEQQQRIWLWLIALAQLLSGVGLLLWAGRTESLAEMAVGRIVMLWGMVTTGVYSVPLYKMREMLRHLPHYLRRRSWWQHGSPMRAWIKMLGVGAISGFSAAVLCGL